MHPARLNDRVVALTGLAIISGGGAAMSGIQLYHLDTLIGVDGRLAWILPLTLDAGAAVASFMWATHHGQVRRWARSIAIGCLIASFVGNVLGALIDHGMIRVTWQLLTGVSGVYPVMCWLMIHLVVLARNAPSKVKATPKAAAKPTTKAQHAAPKPAPTPAPAADVPQPTRMPLHAVGVVSKKEQGRAHFQRLRAAGRPANDITAAEIDAHIGANGYSKKHIADWREEA